MKWLWLLALAACIDASLVPCGDQLCPSGTTCVANELCAGPDQIAACNGLVDGASCTTRGGIGQCDRGVCTLGGCGNGEIDPGETCDDGADNGTDGKCNTECAHVIACGDALVDGSEQCDDGNSNGADGCDACTETTWRASAVIGGNANATAIGLANPTGVAVDRSGNVYVTSYHRIHRIAPSGLITMVAGTGTAGFSGDGGPATSAQLRNPVAVAVDGLGTLYIADSENNRIRRIDAAGTITTVAGTGIAGFSGDGGVATSAQFSSPSGVAVDGLGTLYVADTSNSRIRRIDTAGIITTVAGTTFFGFSGDGGAATSARLHLPSGVAVGLGGLYIADSFNHRIRRVDAAGVITTVAGTGTAGFTGDGGAATSAQLAFPSAVAVDGLGTLYVADSNNHCVRRIDATGVITTIAGTGSRGFSGDGGAATNAELDRTYGVVADGLGALYVADTYNNRIRHIDAAGVITTVAGTGTAGFSGDGGAATSAQLVNPAGVAVDGQGALYVADTLNHRIRRINVAGVITTVAGTGTAGFSGDGGAATSAQLFNPTGVAVDGLGALYVADGLNHRIRRVDAAGIITTIAGTGTAGFSGDGGAAISAQLALPRSLALDGLGGLYVADTNNHRIRRIDAAGVITTVAGTGTSGFSGDGGAATSAQLAFPMGLAVGQLGTLYVADRVSHRIRHIDASGVITTVAGTGTPGFTGDDGAATGAQLQFPSAVAVDGQGNLFVADTNNRRIRRIDGVGTITTVAGTGSPGFSGDGGTATSAQLRDPLGVAVDGLGTLYVADTDNSRIGRIDAAGIITTAAGRIDVEGIGPIPQARLADPRAFVVATPFSLFAGGSSGTLQASSGGWLAAVAGRYPQPNPIGNRARFRDQSFGSVAGVAYDASASVIYLTESSSHRLHVVTIVDPDDEMTWTIAPLANTAGIAGFADGAAATARFREPTGLYFDAATRQLYVADTGNHVIRSFDLSSGIASATVRTIAGVAATRGFYGDGGSASTALLYAPQAITRCTNGDLFIADTDNHRVRRIATTTNVISTVLGVGAAASSGEGRPASTFPVHAPLGLGCDGFGNLLVTSTTSVRLLPSDASGMVDGSGEVQTIYGAPPRDTFPASSTTCLTGLAVIDATTVQVADSCTGILIELVRGLQ